MGTKRDNAIELPFTINHKELMDKYNPDRQFDLLSKAEEFKRLSSVLREQLEGFIRTEIPSLKLFQPDGDPIGRWNVSLSNGGKTYYCGMVNNTSFVDNGWCEASEKSFYEEIAFAGHPAYMSDSCRVSKIINGIRAKSTIYDITPMLDAAKNAFIGTALKIVPIYVASRGLGWSPIELKCRYLLVNGANFSERAKCEDEINSEMLVLQKGYGYRGQVESTIFAYARGTSHPEQARPSKEPEVMAMLDMLRQKF